MPVPIPNQQWTISGRAMRPDGTAFSQAGALVRVTHQPATSQPAPLGQAPLGADGGYSVSYTVALGGTIGGVSPNLLIQLMDARGAVLAAAARSNPRSAEVADLTITSAALASTFVVSGLVSQAGGRPVAGVLVRAFDKDLRRELVLGEDRTDRQGHYTIGYAPAQIGSAIKASADLLVRALDGDGKTLAESPVRFDARPVETIDLRLPAPAERSEFERVGDALAPLLDGMAPAALSAGDVAFIVGQTGLESGQVDAYAAAHRQAAALQVAPAAAYGLLRTGAADARPAAGASQRQRASLKAAVSRKLVPATVEASLDATLAAMSKAGVKALLDAPTAGRAQPIRGLLALALPTAAAQEDFAQAYLDHEGDDASFWSSLAARPLLRDSVPRIQRVLSLDTLSRRHLPMATAVNSWLEGRKATSLRALVALSADDWLAMAKRAGAPDDIPGDTPDERAGNYAHLLAFSVDSAFPTAVLADRLGRNTQIGTPELKQFFTANPDFEFGAEPVAHYIRRTPAATAGVADIGKLAAQLGRVERLFKLSPKAEHIQALLADGLDSAYAITRLGRERFVERYSKGFGGAEKIGLLFDRARQTRDHTQAVGLMLDPRLRPQLLRVLRADPDKELAASADLTELFGSLDFCSCAHCRSLYSPAAYLVDLLQFLDRYGGLGELRGRRPDIFQLELSCENTDTTLPYIDLVNEILEYAVAGSPPPQQIATDGSAAELRAQPQPLDSGVISTAYSTLASALYPIELPFDPWVAEVRIYLDHLGVSRQRLMELFRQDASGAHLLVPLPPLPGGLVSDLPVAQAAEILGLTSLQRRIVTATTDAKPWNLWGIQGMLIGPAANAWVADLQPLASFLARSGLNYDELEDLLAVPYVNPAGALAVVAPLGDPLTCDAMLLRIDKLDADALVRIRRFLALRRALGWEIDDLGRAIAALGGELDDAFLVKLASVERLRAELDQPLDVLLSWCAPLDTRHTGDQERPPLYARLFLNKMVHNPIDPAFAIAVVANPNADAPLAEHADTIQAALRIPASTLALLTDDAISGQALHLPAELPAGARLTLDALSRLFRLVSFSRALGLPIPELLSLKALSGRDPFANPGQTRQFVELAGRVDASGFAIGELNYLLRDVAAAGAPAALTDREIDQLVDELRAALQAIADETAPVANPDGALVAEKLTLALRAENTRELADNLKAVMDILEDSSTLSEEQQRKAIADNCGHFLPDIAAAQAALAGGGDDGAPKLASTADRYSFLFGPLMDYLRRTASERCVKQKLGETFGIELAAASHLLSVALKSQGQPSRPALDDLASVEALDQPAARAALRRLHKAVLLIARLKVNPDELAWLYAVGGTPWLDLNTLPLEPVAGGQPAFNAWLRLVDLLRLRNRLPAGRAALLELLRMHASGVDDAGKSVDFLAELSARSGWPLEDLRFLLGAGGWFAASFAGLPIDRQLVRLSPCFEALRRLGVGAATLLSPAAAWVAPELGGPARQALAKAVKDAAKAKHDEERWPEIAAPLRDELRERQRSALVAHLRWKDKLADSDALFARYLIDVEMSACQLTSRVKQALGSVQTFVQRCLLNLEPTKLSDAAAEEWKWMKVYRVWEANRKVFLYPENWIEPELRDDKSPFFKALESELLQSDLTKESAEDAYMHYLEKLDQVARLEVMGMYHQVEYPSLVYTGPMQSIDRQIFEPVVREDSYRMTAVMSGLADLVQVGGSGGGQTVTQQHMLKQLTTQIDLDQAAIAINPGVSQTSPRIPPDVDVLHVIGRTRNMPQVYFYRQLIDGARWTPWEKIDLDIKGDHLIPVVYNRRLYLIWALIHEVPDEQEDLESKARPTKHLEIQLAWSEHKHGSWEPKRQTSGDPIIVEPHQRGAFFARRWLAAN